MLGQMVSYLAAGKPQKWVEVGALTGFSALCMMESLPVGSELWTCELNAQRSEFLRNIFASPEIAGRIHLIEGDSKASLEKISSCGPFDGIFIDGAKSDYEINLEWAEKNIRTGGSILADNIFLGGDLFAEPNKRNQAMKRFIERLLDPSKFRSVLLPNTDGLWLAQLIGK